MAAPNLRHPQDVQRNRTAPEYHGGMVRFVIIGIVVAVAFTLYALVDAAMTDGARARGVGKPIWVVLIVVLPVIGGVLWFLIGKGEMPQKRPAAPDDDPRFTGTRMTTGDLDSHMKDLEARLRELDSETFPGEEPERPGGAGPQPKPESPKPSDPSGPKNPGNRSDGDLGQS